MTKDQTMLLQSVPVKLFETEDGQWLALGESPEPVVELLFKDIDTSSIKTIKEHLKTSYLNALASFG
ncbi:MAG: hypothetical protein AAGI66_03195 [Cyanobacteria bacterium P01_H01_bin.74]